jgi:outer membrane lipoprotein-sorting protein
MKCTLRRAFPLIGFALFLLGSPSWAEPDFTAVLSKIDEITNFTTDFSGVYAAVKERAGELPLTIQAQMFRRDRESKFVILILAPQAQKGQGYLEIDNNLWFYDPESRLFTHSSLKENWQNSDAMNGDFYRTNYARDYGVESWTEGNLGVYPVHILMLKGKTSEVTYPWKRIWVRKDIGVILKSEDYSLSRRIMRSAYYPTYAKIGSRYVATRMLFVDELNKGNRTQMTLSDPSVQPLAGSTFTKAYLERVNR